MITVNWGAATDVGPVRELNEDSLLACPPVFVVADGMGGHAAGEIASGLVVAEFDRLCHTTGLHADTVLATLKRANEAIVGSARQATGRRGMGTTAVVLAMVTHEGSDYWLACNIGDSRLYRYFDGVVEQLSVDHTEVQELVDAGGITAEAARKHPRRNVISRALGTDPGPTADCSLLPPAPGEWFLLCSDGLSAELTDEAIEVGMAAGGTATEVATRLVRQAVEAGGRDNVTAVVVEVISVDAGTSVEVDDSTHPRPRAGRPPDHGGSEAGQ